MRTCRSIGVLALLLCGVAVNVGPAHAVADHANAHYRVLSAPDCTDAASIIAELAPAPFNATYMRVQHIGDPGTPELAGEVANPVTWNVGAYSGIAPPAPAYALTQRGYRDVGPPQPASAFQLWCGAAGFHLDTRQFSHAVPVVLGGPSVSIARDLVPGAAVFANGTSELTIDARVGVPYVRYDTPPVLDGTAQVSFFYYARDTTTGTVFAHVVALFDNRASGVNGAGSEGVSADAYTAFVASPLAPRTHDGAPTQFVTVSPHSDTMRFQEGWPDLRFFRMHVSYAQFGALLARLRRTSLPAISPRPEDYRVTLFGVLGEVFPGTGTAHEVALAAGVTDLRLAEAYDDVVPVPVIEFHHAQRDHYFMSARAADIAALDSGTLAGWTRTGRQLSAYPVFVPGQAPVCRFYLPPAFGDSHFFSASARECADVAARHPGFVLEDAAVMHVGLPDPVTGECAVNEVPVFRVWNGRSDTNHRYTTDAAVRAQMLAAGWLAEGYGPGGVAMCAPRP
jgi:hypothetical protein